MLVCPYDLVSYIHILYDTRAACSQTETPCWTLVQYAIWSIKLA